MKFAADRPYGDPEKAARKLVEIANAIEPAQDGRAGAPPRYSRRCSAFTDRADVTFHRLFLGRKNRHGPGLRIAALRAIHRNDARVFNPDRKDPHWGKRKLKRDE
jgi:hypothetical protein